MIPLSGNPLMIDIRRLLIFCCMLSLSITVVAAPPRTSRDEIEHLIHYVETSECQFDRNDEWRSGVDAAAHLRDKYNYVLFFWGKPTAEQFIKDIASNSSYSGRPYVVRCGNGPLTPSADWLFQELRRYRAGNSNS